MTNPIRLDVSRILTVSIGRVVVVSVTDLSTEVMLNAQVEKQISDYLGRRMLRRLQGGGSGSSSGSSGSGSGATIKKQLFPGLSIEVGVGLGRNPDVESVPLILNATANSLKIAMEARGSQFLPLFSTSLLTETTTIVSPVSYSIAADLSSLRFVSQYVAPVKGIDIIAIIAGSSSAGGAIAIFLFLTVVRAYFAYRARRQIELRTIKPVMMDNPLRGRGGRGRLNKDAKTKIFLPVPEHALEIQNKKLMDIRFREQQHLIEEERKQIEEAKKAPEVEKRRIAAEQKAKEEVRKVQEAARAQLDLEQEMIRTRLEDEEKRALDEHDKVIQSLKTKVVEKERLIKNIKAGAYRHAWVKVSIIKNTYGEDEDVYIPFLDRLADTVTREGEWVRGQFEVADPKVPLDSKDERNCYIRKEERIHTRGGTGRRYGKVWFEHKQTGARKERLPFGGIIKECEIVDVDDEFWSIGKCRL